MFFVSFVVKEKGMSIIAQLGEGVLCRSAEETQAVAASLAAILPPDTVLALRGDLGAGKTTFVQGLARAWGIEGPVTSPTFAIYAPYHGARLLIHVDAYRLTDAGAGEDLLIEDLLESPWCLAVEWPERIQDTWWLQDAWTLTFESLDDTNRRIRLSIPKTP